MMKRTKVDSQFLKTLNELRILNLIKNEGPISRIEIAKRTNISKVAVSEIVGRLDQDGYILEIGKGQSTKRGGKRPTLIKLNPTRAYVIAIEIRREKTHIALADLDSQIVDSAEVTYEAGASMESVLPKVFKKITYLTEKHKIPKDHLVSIGIGLPGFIDYQKGDLIFADTLRGWDNRPLARQFRAKFGVPVIVENDVNAITLGEYLLGAGKESRNLVCLWIGEGIGAGIVVNGELIRGDYGSAGEIGYMELGHHVSNREYFRHLYSNQKYFGDVLGEVNLREALRSSIRWNLPEPPQDLDALSTAELLSDRFERFGYVREVLDEYAMLLSILSTDLIKTINPNLLIMTGTVIESSDYLFQKIKQNLRQHMVNIPFEPTKMALGRLTEDACLKGIIVMAQRLVFDPYRNNTLSYVQLPKS